MDQEDVKGALRGAAGKVEDVAGEFAGQTRRAARQAQTLGSDAVHQMRGLTVDQPLTALLLAGAAGFLLGSLLRRP